MTTAHPYLYYLAAPFAAKNYQVSLNRADVVSRVAVSLIEHKYCLFSPLSQGMGLLEGGAPTDDAFWDRVNLPVLTRCSHFLIVPLPGWQHSSGIRRELDLWIDSCGGSGVVAFVIPTGTYWELMTEPYWVSKPNIPRATLNRICDTEEFILLQCPAKAVLDSMKISTGDKNDLPY